MASVRAREKFMAWLKIMRIHFYPMPWINYSLGAAAAYATAGKFDLSIYALGYFVLFLLEFCTILINEYYDYPTDRINRNASPFNGGTRVLVEGKLGFKEIKAGIAVVLFLVIGSAYALMAASRSTGSVSVLFLILLGFLMGLGYTAPPLKFCYRGLGEMVVSITHSVYVILCGYVFQTGIWNNSLPWLLSVPLFFATLAAITLASIPDYHADVVFSKKTISVILGPRFAAGSSTIFISFAAASGMLLWYFKILDGPYSGLILLVVPHCLILLFSVLKLVKANNYDRKINTIMQLALSYIVWFGLVPLINLLEISNVL